MFVDLRLAEMEAEYRRQKLARSYPKQRKVIDHTATVLAGSPRRANRFARLLLLNR
jgi:hypothetical protein